MVWNVSKNINVTVNMVNKYQNGGVIILTWAKCHAMQLFDTFVSSKGKRNI